MSKKLKSKSPLDAANCSRIVITLEITDPEIVADYRDTCDELLCEDLVDGELINFAEFVSRENVPALAQSGGEKTSTKEKTDE